MSMLAIYISLDGFLPFYGWDVYVSVAIKCPCFDGASMWDFFVFDDHIRGNEADSADLFATWQP